MCGLVACVGTTDIYPYLWKMRYRGTQPPRIIQGTVGSVGHVRLPIVGLSDDYAQPVKDGRSIIAFVGEVLDFRDKDPQAESDLHLVTTSWRMGGGGALRGHDGFWSVVILDEHTHELYAFCDYLAQKPLYYRQDLRIVASELSPLSDCTTWDEIYFSACAKWGYCPEIDRTPYQEVKRVRPGELVTLAVGEPLRREIVDPLIPMEMSAEQLKVEIEEAVRRRATAVDVPVAALVSGGLDSAITYTLAKRYCDVHAYHVENNEGIAASIVVGDDKATFLDCWDVSVEKGLKYMQEPIDLGSLLPQVAISEAIARRQSHEHVALSGDGADELFGGYSRASRYDSQASDVWHELVAWHLPRLDRVMMRNTIELRSPFLARRVAAAALALPWEERKNKKILRDLFRDDLPKHVADLPKKALRTKTVEDDREGRSLEMIRLMREERHGGGSLD